MTYTTRTATVRFEAPVNKPDTPLPWGWANIPHPDPEVNQIHLMPLSDTGCHSFDRMCACGPCEKQGLVYHYAFDGREAYEVDPGRKKH